MRNRLIDALNDIDDKYIEEANNINKKAKFLLKKLEKPILALCCLFLLVMVMPKMATSEKDEAPEANYVQDSNSTYEGSFMTDLSSNESLDYQNKKLIVTAYLRLETVDLDPLLDNLNNSINKYNGYYSYSSLYSNYENRRTFEATIRIPSDQYKEFLQELDGLGNKLSYNESVNDISDIYYDLEARANSLKNEEARIVEFYKEANTIDELMQIENRLSEIRYEIDSLETSLKNYDLEVTYSTLTINITETSTYSKTNDGFFVRLANSFKNGGIGFLNNIQDIVINSAYYFYEIILIVAVVLGVYFLYKKRKNRK